MTVKTALPIAALLALAACSGGSTTENVTVTNTDLAVEENLVSEDLGLNDTALEGGNETLGNVDAAANSTDADAANGATNAL
jgi:hypothetical protein